MWIMRTKFKWVIFDHYNHMIGVPRIGWLVLFNRWNSIYGIPPHQFNEMKSLNCPEIDSDYQILERIRRTRKDNSNGQ